MAETIIIMVKPIPKIGKRIGALMETVVTVHAILKTMPNIQEKKPIMEGPRPGFMLFMKIYLRKIVFILKTNDISAVFCKDLHRETRLIFYIISYSRRKIN